MRREMEEEEEEEERGSTVNRERKVEWVRVVTHVLFVCTGTKHR